MIRHCYVWGEEVKRSIEWLIKRLIKVGAGVSYHARRWIVYVPSAFPLAYHYSAGLRSLSFTAMRDLGFEVVVCLNFLENCFLSEICASIHITLLGSETF
jgi:hypothetical protein